MAQQEKAPGGILQSRIAVVGAGSVGSTIAYTLLTKPVASEILIVEPQEEFRDAQVQDLSDASYHGNTSTLVRAGTHKEAGQCDIVIITAGAAQKQGESRTDLVGKNKAILQSVIDDMKPFAENTILLTIANPNDVLTHFTLQYSGLPKQQVLGAGTFLDSARLRGALANKAGVAASSINAYVLGEHGESQFVAWSCANVAGVPLSTFPATTNIDRKAIAEDTKQKAGWIIEKKGATNFGIASVTASICESILFDQKGVIPVSHYQHDLKVCLSKPAVLSRKGIESTVELPLSEDETAALKESAKSLRDIIDESEKAK
ncbi:hypothetical protein LTR10_011479 [Elasticomyces elasticus]|nr:hypothetical protein LTR10_011479 [Elasticomyces elasticus]KAK4966116.1 hypothetical protein LTR42_011276 [Elasticomyces elasticus]